MIKTLDITKGESKNLYKYLSSSVTPRPIALVSTIDKLGRKNLAPFSFFNVFSISPPILVFSPAKNSRLLKNKDTLVFDQFEIKCAIGKKALITIKLKVIKLHQKVFLVLVKFIGEKIE